MNGEEEAEGSLNSHSLLKALCYFAMFSLLASPFPLIINVEKPLKMMMEKLLFANFRMKYRQEEEEREKMINERRKKAGK
jgi:hypothetical protein